jgi:hypothetical protein
VNELDLIKHSHSAVREVIMKAESDRADYVLYVGRRRRDRAVIRSHTPRRELLHAALSGQLAWRMFDDEVEGQVAAK